MVEERIINALQNYIETELTLLLEINLKNFFKCKIEAIDIREETEDGFEMKQMFIIEVIYTFGKKKNNIIVKTTKNIFDENFIDKLINTMADEIEKDISLETFYSDFEKSI